LSKVFIISIKRLFIQF